MKKKKALNLKNSEIRELILKYLEKHKKQTVYPVDIANHYKLNGWKTFQITQEMKEQGLIH
ncbi:hypothetical protein LCGC14_1977270 [marine sediment metagenome]|uniref:LexA repressor DNA-binding domain-containing protein n=1 Tax=marine sediment metagenome TaxID=412755 RepID=A0A0F9F9V8_9ZZZZ